MSDESSVVGSEPKNPSATVDGSDRHPCLRVGYCPDGHPLTQVVLTGDDCKLIFTPSA